MELCRCRCLAETCWRTTSAWDKAPAVRERLNLKARVRMSSGSVDEEISNRKESSVSREYFGAARSTGPGETLEPFGGCMGWGVSGNGSMKWQSATESARRQCTPYRRVAAGPLGSTGITNRTQSLQHGNLPVTFWSTGICAEVEFGHVGFRETDHHQTRKGELK